MLGIPVVKRDYADTEKVTRAVDNIMKVIKPGDVINTEAQLQSWWDVAESVAWNFIWADQKYVFGEKSRYKDEHSTLFLNRDLICSVEPPRAKYIDLRDCCLDKLWIYRYTKYEFQPEDIEFLRTAYFPIWGTPYDFGQLLDILINTLFGDEDYMKFKLFDFSKRDKVCSVGVRILYEAFIKHKNKSLPEGKKLHHLFRELNPEHAGEAHVKERFFHDKPRPGEDKHEKRSGVDVEMTTPAHYANTQFFDNEFELVAVFEQGERVDETRE